MEAAELQDRADAAVARLPFSRRVELLSGRDMWRLRAFPDAGIPGLMVADGPHGIRKQAGPAEALGLFESVPATCFPPAVTLASTWDPELAEEVGRAVGAEARALGVGVVLGPGLNLKRHPCCGRTFEYFSEDPLLSGRMAAGVVRGIQSAGVGACVKHFAVNNQETRRMTLDAVVDERTLRELYLRGFEIAVTEARPWAVMCAYNRVDGEYCSDSRRLLTRILREEWGFDGLVMSDWGATNDRVAALDAGMDLEMPSSAGANDGPVGDAVGCGRLDGGAVDRSAVRVAALAMRAAAAVPDPGAGERVDARLAEGHHALARRVAAEGTVLLANDGVLPLAPGVSVAVIGAFAVEPRFQGTGSSQVAPVRLDTALDALRAHSGEGRALGAVRYAAGYDASSGGTSDALVAEAVHAARGADVALVFAGLPAPYESEGFDRTHLCLPDGHTRLIEAVCGANPATVVVLSNGGPVEMEWAARPAAIIEAYLGGQAGGSAIADVLLGVAEPGGRLAETFPRRLKDLPADENFPGAGDRVEYREALNVGYRYFASPAAEREALFPFGHGLSYTTFEFGQPRTTGDTPTVFDADRDGERLPVRVPVTNTGPRAGSAVVQLYARMLEPVAARPAMELRGFAKLRLGPGERGEAVVDLDRRAFAHFDADLDRWCVEPGEYEVLAGASSADIRGRLRVRVASSDPVRPTRPLPARVADTAAFEELCGRPVGAPRPVRPFSRTTAIDDLGASVLGRVVRWGLLRAASRQAEGSLAERDETAGLMMERVMREMPLRNVVTMSQGRLSWRALDALIDALNGRWLAAARRLAGGRARERC